MDGAAPEQLLEGLSATQRDAVTISAAPLCLLAGAGSGKTRVLTRRIAHRTATGEIDPRRVLALTFTRKAARELRHRLRTLGLRDQVQAGTFHSVAYAQLRERWGERRAPTLLARPSRLIADVLAEHAGGRATSNDLGATVVAQEIGWARARRIDPGDYLARAAATGRTVVLPTSGRAARRDPLVVVAETFVAYDAHKRQKHLVDFDDLLEQCTELLARDPEFAAIQRWRFRHLFVDEFQDVNPLQFELLTGWLGDNRDLCVVGDPNQAIYGWNGADAGYLRDVDRYFPSATTVSLGENFRSTPEIVRAAHAVLGTTGNVGAIAVRPDGSAPVVDAFEDEQAEATGVARAIRDHHRTGGSFRTQAVLARTNAQLRVIEDTLRSAGIPAATRKGGRLMDRPETSALLRDLAASTAPLATLLADLERDLRAGVATESAQVLTELVELGREHLDEGGDAATFGPWLRALEHREQLGDGEDAVALTTFHAAKGLEWRVVHLVGLEEGLVPIAHARNQEALDEERRLLYVAMTRATDVLRLTWAARRQLGTSDVVRKRSRFLDALEAGTAAKDDHRAAGDAGLEAARAALAEHVTPDRATEPTRPEGAHDHATTDRRADALRRWRAAQARRADTTEEAVLRDEVLAAIAQAAPHDLEGLGAVRGIGPMLVARLGPALLDALAEAGQDATSTSKSATTGA